MVWFAYFANMISDENPWSFNNNDNNNNNI